MQAFEDALACASHGSQCQGPPNDARIIICIWHAIRRPARWQSPSVPRTPILSHVIATLQRHCPASCRVDCHGSNRATKLQTPADNIILKALLVYSCQLSRISYPKIKPHAHPRQHVHLPTSGCANRWGIFPRVNAAYYCKTSSHTSVTSLKRRV
jgi:hypothetical protein